MTRFEDSETREELFTVRLSTLPAVGQLISFNDQMWTVGESIWDITETDGLIDIELIYLLERMEFS